MLDGLIISVDAMGGDNAPDIVIKGIEYFLSHDGEGRRARFQLHGDAEALAPLLEAAPRTRERSEVCLLYTSPSPRDATLSRMPSSA